MTQPAPKLATPIRIAPAQLQQTLTKGQKAFNTLIAHIEANRKELADWQLAAEGYRQRVVAEIEPLQKNLRAARFELAWSLDKALDRHPLTKSEGRSARDFLCHLAETLMDACDDDSMKALFNKHSDVDFDAQAEEEAKRLQSTMQNIFGFELDDDDLDAKSPQEVLEKMRLGMEKDQMEYQEQRLQQEEKRSLRKKSAKQLEREAKAKQEAQNVSLSIREVYRKLVSALHPDREPDADERARKTVLMQRVNQAYDKRDLMQLLELQLELEHIDAKSIAGLSEERLKHFNKVLRDQLGELVDEIHHVQGALRAQFRMSPYERLLPSQVVPMLSKDVTQLKYFIKRLNSEALMVLDLPSFKAWLKALKQSERAEKAMRRRQADSAF